MAFIHQSLNYCEEIGLEQTVQVVAALNADFESLKKEGFESDRAKFLVMEKFKKQIAESFKALKHGGVN